MSEAKPTPGEWRAKQLGGYENPGWVILWPDKGGTHMRRLDYQGNFTESDARLIADAGTVFHTTGLTPSQLVERVKELEEAAKLVLDWYEAENDHSKTDFYQRVQMCRDSEDALRAALSKARPNTAEGE